MKLVSKEKEVFQEGTTYNQNEVNLKKFWSFIKSKKKENSGVAPLMKNGTVHSDSQAKADILNMQFSSVFIIGNASNAPSLGVSPYSELPHITVSVAGVRKLLENIKPHKATGPDGIPARLLKDYAADLAPVLSHIYQASLSQGRVPPDWKHAWVIPVFKKGARNSPSNYRPISFTSIACKTLEHIIHSNLMNHLERHNILSDHQHGFRKRRSCEMQLIQAVDDLAKCLNEGGQIDAVLLDFSKAFDKVSHHHLATKLHHYGMRGKMLEWVQSFLSSRTQEVILEGKKSSPAPVTSGVPQGSVLAPILFLCYINDLPNQVSSTVRLFADDCLLYRNINTTHDAETLQEDIDKLQTWEADWLMKFNPDKCEIIRRKKKIVTNYSIHEHQLKEVKGAKYLGVTIDRTPSWNEHINNVTKKANNTRAFLQRNINRCPEAIKTLCYQAFVRPIVEHASTVWDPSTEKNIKSGENVQRQAARFVKSDYRRRSSVTTMLESLNWVSLASRRAEAKLVMLYRITNNLVDV